MSLMTVSHYPCAEGRRKRLWRNTRTTSHRYVKYTRRENLPRRRRRYFISYFNIPTRPRGRERHAYSRIQAKLAYKWEDVTKFYGYVRAYLPLQGAGAGEKRRYNGFDEKGTKQKASVCLNNYILEYN